MWRKLAILSAVTIIVALLLFLTAPRTKKRALEQYVPEVETVTVTSRPFRPEIVAYGVAFPKNRATVTAQVSGMVTNLPNTFSVGGIMQKGELLLELDDRDYVARVAESEAALARAEFDLKLEEGRQVVAGREWELLGENYKDSPLAEELALRRPHMREKLAAVEGAKGRLEQSRLALERTRIYAPFDAVVLEESVEEGQFVAASQPLGTLAGTATFQMVISLPYEELMLALEGNKEAKVIQGGELYSGRLVRYLKDVEEGGRMARALVAVHDPLRLKTGQKPLLLGSYVQVLLEGPILDGVFVLPRSLLREDDTLWIKNEEDLLEIRPVTVFLRNEDHVVVSEGLEEEERVVTSPLNVAIPGMRLRER